jgi:uncharacterized damage-inducible protein DinB
MTSSFSVANQSFADYYQMIRDKVHELVEPLSDEQIWRRPYPYGNSVGNLLLHLTGNLSYYIGAQIAQDGYIRHRDLEFTDKGKPKKELLRNFDATIDMVIATVRKQSAEDWSAAYSAEREPEATNRFAAFLRCAGHAYHHVGQLIYLQKELLLPQSTSAR